MGCPSFSRSACRREGEVDKSKKKGIYRKGEKDAEIDHSTRTSNHALSKVVEEMRGGEYRQLAVSHRGKGTAEQPQRLELQCGEETVNAFVIAWEIRLQKTKLKITQGYWTGYSPGVAY